MPCLLLIIFVFFLQTLNKFAIKVTDDWIRTRVLLYRKRPCCQVCHNQCTCNSNILLCNLVQWERYEFVNDLWVTDLCKNKKLPYEETSCNSSIHGVLQQKVIKAHICPIVEKNQLLSLMNCLYPLFWQFTNITSYYLS